MLKKFFILILIFIVIISGALYIQGKDSEEVNTENIVEEITQIDSIKYLPPTFIEGSNQKGKVEKIEYYSYKYAENNEKILKPAYVYLPYGYDTNDTETKYDIVYLMHGFEETAERMFLEYNTYNNYNLSNILDNMIANGDIKPVIVVTPTFISMNQQESFEESVKQMNVFHKELINDLIPAVESKYHTYASSTDIEGIKASRGHRAFGGFSMGAATTWNQVIYSIDYIKYFLPMSGDCWAVEPNGGLTKPEETAKLVEQAIIESGYKDDEFLIYSVTGTDDILYEQVNNHMNEMIKLNNTFTKQNLRYRLRENGTHGYNFCMEYIYDALPNFFGRK